MFLTTTNLWTMQSYCFFLGVCSYNLTANAFKSVLLQDSVHASCRWHIEGEITHDWRKLADRKAKQLRKLSDSYMGQLDKVPPIAVLHLCQACSGPPLPSVCFVHMVSLINVAISRSKLSIEAKCKFRAYIVRSSRCHDAVTN